MENGRYMVVLPDPGEHIRALSGEDEIVLSVPKSRLEDFISGLQEDGEGRIGVWQRRPYDAGRFPPAVYVCFLRDGD
jgi:hypothetical protein